ncbi:MAG: hypothetical protein QNJ31_07250 [Candidatus Caenarcaniphilales bacterium]|nr:hypothetical protein [Candidatus Caenarcaniphilales bacterium]
MTLCPNEEMEKTVPEKIRELLKNKENLFSNPLTIKDLQDELSRTSFNNPLIINDLESVLYAASSKMEDYLSILEEQFPNSLSPCSSYSRHKDFSRSKIVLPVPQGNRFHGGTLGMGGTAQVDSQTGSLILTRSSQESVVKGQRDGWLDPSGYFKKLDFHSLEDLKREFPSAQWNRVTNTEAPIIQITEVLEDGAEETYFIAPHQKNEANQDIALVLCKEGGMQTLYYGQNRNASFAGRVLKPVFSFRNFEVGNKLTIEVNEFAGNYEVIYPQTPIIESSNSVKWDVRTATNNLIEVNDKKYPYLFWDGGFENNFDMSNATCIHRSQVIEYLEEECSKFHFDETVTADFVTFWAPYLMRSEWVIVRFLIPEECNQVAKVNIKPEQDSIKPQLIRAYVVYKPLDKQVSNSPSRFSYPVFEENKPTIFDWGGFEHVN